MQKMKIKSTNQDVINLWEELQKIFLNDYRGVNARIERELKSLGIELYGCSHPKLKIKNKVVVLTSSSGQLQTGRAILRTIRKILEQED